MVLVVLVVVFVVLGVVLVVIEVVASHYCYYNPPFKKLELPDRVAGGLALVRARVQALRENANITVATAFIVEKLFHTSLLKPCLCFEHLPSKSPKSDLV